MKWFINFWCLSVGFVCEVILEWIFVELVLKNSKRYVKVENLFVFKFFYVFIMWRVYWNIDFNYVIIKCVVR